MHYETIQGTEISLPLSSNQQDLIRAVSGDFFMSLVLFLVAQWNKLEESSMLGVVPSQTSSYLMAS